jgi:thioredoxin reductase
VVFAVGVAEPYRPPVPGLNGVPHYGELRPAPAYSDRRVFIIGKQNSGFEIATGLLPYARQLILASPSPTRLSVNTRSLVGVRARYVQPYEDAALAGGVVILDATIEEVAIAGAGYRIRTGNPHGAAGLTFDADDVIAATGFTAPLRDLPALGVATVGQSKVPVQTPFFESATARGIFFAGTISQGAPGLKKYGIPSNSGAVQGHRYNARLLAQHLAETHFGRAPSRAAIDPASVVPMLLADASHSPELWHQRSYLARVVSVNPHGGAVDDGILPLAHFLDSSGPDAVSIALESNGKGDPYPAVYVRHRNVVSEHLLAPHPLLQFEGSENAKALASALEPVLSRSASPA